MPYQKRRGRTSDDPSFGLFCGRRRSCVAAEDEALRRGFSFSSEHPNLPLSV